LVQAGGYRDRLNRTKSEKKMKRILPFVMLLALVGCGVQRPVLYPNDYLNAVGDAQAEEDIEECVNQADVYVRSNPGEQVAGSTVVGGAAGGVIGAAGGAVVGSLGRGAAIGGATGATAGLIRGLSKASQPSPTHKNFVDRCLREKGYEPIGWR
jgi:predicted small lipoprotein YifL